MSIESAVPMTGCRVRSEATWLKDCLLVFLVSAIWCCGLIGFRPLANPDEGRYTEIPREMAESGDYITPRLNGVKYFEKPPLLYWMSAAIFKVAGVNEFTARLANAFFASLGIVATYLTARSLYGRAAGFSSALVLGTSFLYHAMSQIVLLDMAVAATMAGALFAFLLAVKEAPGKKRFLLFMAFYGFMALAVLAKGLIGFLLPGAIMFIWVLTLNRWRALWPFYPIVGTALLLAIAAPWHILAARANHDFLQFYFVHEHFERFTTRVHGRYQPWWFFLPMLVVGLFPWIAFAGNALKQSLAGGWKKRAEHEDGWFFVIWIVFVVLFFSASQSKLIPYILPVFPAAAVLLGRAIADIWQNPEKRSIRAAGWIFVGLIVALLAGVIFAPAPRNQPALAEMLPLWRWVLGGVFTVTALIAFVAHRNKCSRVMIATIACSFSLFLFCATFVWSEVNRGSTKPLAEILKPRLQADDRIYHVRFYGQDMPPYLGRLVSVVDYQGELEFGIAAEPAVSGPRFLNGTAFLDQWTAPGTAYAVLRKADYLAIFDHSNLPRQVLGQANGMVLIVNKAES